MSAGGIAIIGAGMIGAAHASAYRSLLPRFQQSIPGCSLHTVCDSNPDLAGRLATTYGFAHVARDWRAVLDNPDIGIVSVCLPNFLHVEVTAEALRKGKHVLCEKPLALSASEARPLVDLAAISGSVSGTVFNYRRIPALAEIRARLAAGDLGRPVQIMVGFQCDYAADPELPHSWRYEFDRAGPGTRIERGLADLNGLLEQCEVTDVANRSWNHVAVGAGKDLQWWKEFFSVVRMTGYDVWVSLEMEDFTMSTEAGIRSSIEALQAAISR